MDKREILFRGIEIETKEWIYGDYINNSKIDPFTYITIGTGYKIGNPKIGKPLKVYPDSVGQFTGEIDKKGVKIFPSDILDINTAFSQEYGKDIPFHCIKAVIERGMFNFCLESKQETEYVEKGSNHYKYSISENRDNVYYLSQIDSYECEVIGNVIDNPELLK